MIKKPLLKSNNLKTNYRSEIYYKIEICKIKDQFGLYQNYLCKQSYNWENFEKKENIKEIFFIRNTINNVRNTTNNVNK